MDEFLVLVLVLPFFVVIGGLVIGALALHQRARLKELAYRERIAMIERGIVPPSETDPARLDPAGRDALGAPGESAIRHRTAGVAFIAIGLGLMLIISFAGNNPGVGIGVGGATMVIGAAGLVNSFFVAQDEARRAAGARRAAAPPPAPPGNDVRP